MTERETISDKQWRMAVANLINKYNSLEDEPAEATLRRFFKRWDVSPLQFDPIKFILDNTRVDGMSRKIADMLRPPFVVNETREFSFIITVRYEVRNTKGGANRQQQIETNVRKMIEGFDFVEEVSISN